MSSSKESKESYDEMIDNDEPNDSMTLDQFQKDVQKEALVHKVAHISTNSHKKGLVVKSCDES